MNHMIADNIETWMPVDGYDNYEVSSVWRVRNNRSGRMMGKSDNQRYLKVVLCNSCRMKTHKVHRLVAKYLCKNPDGNNQVDPIDQNRQNNRYNNKVDNLQ